MPEPKFKPDEKELKLLDEMGFVENEKEKGLYETVIENGFADVDYRKENGRRWAKVGSTFVKKDEIDKIPILKAFKEARDKLKEVKHDTTKDKDADNEQNILTAQRPGQGEGELNKSPSIEQPESLKDKQDSQKDNMEAETILKKNSLIPPLSKVQTSPPPTLDKAQQPTPPLAASQSPNLYEFFLELVGAGGIIEIFGDTGSLKSQVCTEVCKDAKKLNKTFFYLDTEGKVGLGNKKTLGNAYKYLPVWEEIVKMLTKDLPKYDLFIVDSIGFPIATEYADMKANEQGSALQDMMAVVGKHLKAWAFKNNAIVVFTNQPKSAFMKSEQELNRLDPFGDKVHFAANLILNTKKTIIPGHFDPKTQKLIPVYSIATFTSHRSTDFADDRIMFLLHKNDDGVKVEITDYVIKRLQELKG